MRMHDRTACGSERRAGNGVNRRARVFASAPRVGFLRLPLYVCSKNNIRSGGRFMRRRSRRLRRRRRGRQDDVAGHGGERERADDQQDAGMPKAQ